METIHHYLENYAQLNPQKLAVIDSETDLYLSFFELHERVETLASKLVQLITTDDVVVVVSRNRLTLVEYILGCSRIGVRCLPVVEPGVIEPTLQATRNQQKPVVFYSNHEDQCFKKEGENWIEIETVSALEEHPIDFIPKADSPFYVNTTGGTTGMPKLVVASNLQVLNNTLFALKAFSFNEDDVHLSAFQFHAHDWFVRGICSGATTVLVNNGVDYPNVMKEIIQYAPTALMAGPPLLNYLTMQRQSFPRSLRQIECGGAKLEASIIAKSKERFGVTITPVWGSTETTGIVLSSKPGTLPKGAIGKPIGDYKVDVIDRMGNPVPLGEVGQMVISSKAVADGYLDRHQEYEGLSQGTAHTGDLVKMDSAGFLYVVGRMKNQFKRMGFSLNSETIEAVLNEQPEIEGAMVVPLPGFGGFYPIVLVETSLDEVSWNRKISELKGRIEQRLDHSVLSFPNEWLIVSAIPRKASGKLDRQAGYAVIQNQQYLKKHNFSLSWKAYLQFLLEQVIHNRRMIKPIIRGIFSIDVSQMIKEKFVGKRKLS